MPLVIGLTGKAHSGKDTVGEVLQRGYGFFTHSWAEPLKQAASHIFGLGLEHFHNQELKEIRNEYWGMTPREMLLVLGTEACRDVIDNDIWIKRGMMEIQNRLDNGAHVVVTDTRFPNEAEAIKKMGGYIIEVVRPEGSLEVNHRSGQAMPRELIDFTLMNDNTLAYLQQVAVFDLMYEVHKKAGLRPL